MTPPPSSSMFIMTVDHHLTDQIAPRRALPSWRPHSLPPIASTVLIVALIGLSGRSMAEISADIRLTPPARTQAKIRFHSSCDACPGGICPRDSASLFLADLGQFFAPISAVRSCGAPIQQSVILPPLGSSPWHSRVPPGPCHSSTSYELLPLGRGDSARESSPLFLHLDLEADLFFTVRCSIWLGVSSDGP